MSFIRFEINLDDLWGNEESFAEVLQQEVRHEFRLAIRRAIKSDKSITERAQKIAKRLNADLEQQILEMLKAA